MLATKQNMTIGMYTVEACRKKYPIIPIVINPINEIPVAKPSNPSIKLIALVIPKIQKMVTGKLSQPNSI